MEEIFIQGLEIFGYHGVYQQEKEAGQNFLVDLVCDVDFHSAVKSDDLSDTTDYGNLCLYMKRYFEEHSFDLLETLAEELAISLLHSFPGIQRLQLTIHKPQAPIPMEFIGVGVHLTKGWIPVAISMGSNMGDREEFLNQAMEQLIRHPGIRDLVVSDYQDTEPYGYLDQDRFLNGAAVFETYLSPEELLELLHSIEDKAGRKRTIHWGPRTLDLDILLYGDYCCSKKDLVIPHLDMCNRRFVLDPLAEIAPGMVHPLRQATIYDLRKRLEEKQE
jgi:dihydroneopterin aldolase/2-amino-4-hydroxy-6-hydroxymethyldihydropteridine diphosphokinase